MDKDLRDILKICYHEVELLDSRIAELKKRVDLDPEFRKALADELMFNGLVSEVQTQVPRWLNLNSLLDEEEIESIESSVMDKIFKDDRANKARGIVKFITTLAAGLAIGFLGTSAVYGKNIFKHVKESVFVFYESFEDDPVLDNSGLPTVPGKWGGDTAVIVVSENSIIASHGKNMLKVLKSEFVGEEAENSRTGSLYYLLDLEQLKLKEKRLLGKLKARFNKRVSTDCSYGLILFALDESFVFPKQQKSPLWIYENSLATSRRMVNMEGEKQWKDLSIDLLIPEKSKYLVISVHFENQDKNHKGVTSFKGHYVDEIKLEIDKYTGIK